MHPANPAWPWRSRASSHREKSHRPVRCACAPRSEEHTSELQSPCNLVCRLLLEKKNKCSMTTRLGNAWPEPLGRAGLTDTDAEGAGGRVGRSSSSSSARVRCLSLLFQVP